MRGDYDIPRTNLKIEFDHRRDDYYSSHGLHCHVVSGHNRIASVSLETLTLMAGSLDGKDGRLAMEWIKDNFYTLKSDAEYWRDNGAVWQA